MVCKEIEVVTKSYDKKEVLEIHIPNYDGCFFIKKTANKEAKTGTSITLYEDERELIDYEKIIKYIKEVMLDFQLDIKIHDNISNTTEIWKSHYLKKNCTFSFCS